MELRVLTMSGKFKRRKQAWDGAGPEGCVHPGPDRQRLTLMLLRVIAEGSRLIYFKVCKQHNSPGGPQAAEHISPCSEESRSAKRRQCGHTDAYSLCEVHVSRAQFNTANAHSGVSS